MSDDDKGTEEATFTRAQVRQMIGAEVRKVRESYADYDDLKRIAAEAEGSKSKLDQVIEKLEASESRSKKAELAVVRREVADELGLTPRQAKRLTGETRAELLDDGRDLLDDLGIKPTAKRTPTVKTDDETDDSVPVADEQDEEQPEDDEPAPVPAAPRRTARPRETLRSGAPRTQTQPEETDPAKLAALIPRR